MEDDSYKLGFFKWQVTSPPDVSDLPNIWRQESQSLPQVFLQIYPLVNNLLIDWEVKFIQD